MNLKELKDELIKKGIMVESVEEFDFYATLTIHPNNGFDIKDIKNLKRQLADVFKEYEEKNVDFKYVCVYEENSRKDGWHIHALLTGIDEGDIKNYIKRSQTPVKIWSTWSSVGYSILLPIDSNKLARKGFIEGWNAAGWDAAIIGAEKYAENKKLLEHISKYWSGYDYMKNNDPDDGKCFEIREKSKNDIIAYFEITDELD